MFLKTSAKIKPFARKGFIFCFIRFQICKKAMKSKNLGFFIKKLSRFRNLRLFLGIFRWGHAKMLAEDG